MIRAAHVSVFLILASCAATTADLSERPAALELSTQHARAAVAECIARAWGHTRGYSVSVIPGSDRTAIMLSGMWGTEAAAEIYDGGRVIFRRRPAPIHGTSDQIFAAARPCL